MSRSTASARRTSRPHDIPISDLEPRPPRWVDEVLGPHASTIDVGPHVRAIAAGPLVMLTSTIALASEMPADRLRAEVSEAYRRLEGSLAAMGRWPVRFWNFIPRIGESMGQGLDRYMVFNAGRYDACTRRNETTEPPGPPIATASAVGVGGTDLVVHCLASTSAGVPVENPRQIPSWQYSERYGPRPPRFSRATIATLGSRTALLIGGTASIVGEQSRHHGNIEAQLDETLRNIGTLVTAARQDSNDQARALQRIVDLRVYATGDDVARLVRCQLTASCPNARRVEIVRARVCRPELLLEIEGVAEI